MGCPGDFQLLEEAICESALLLVGSPLLKLFVGLIDYSALNPSSIDLFESLISYQKLLGSLIEWIVIETPSEL